MKLYVRSFLLIFGALLLTNCASYQSEVTQDASVLKSVEEQVVADGPSDKSALAEVEPVLHDNKIICKKVVVTGSKIPTRKVCATKKQWLDRTKVPREQWKNELNHARRYSS